MNRSITILTFLILIILYNLSTFSQTNPIPNHSFELWAGNDPVGWTTENADIPGSTTLSTDAQDGLFSAKLTKQDTFTWCGGKANAYLLGGAKINERYSSFRFYIKSTDNPESNCWQYECGAVLFKNGVQIGIGGEEIDLSATTGWTEKLFDINYSVPDVPDSVFIAFVLYDSVMNPSSYVLIDNVSLIDSNKLTITRPLGGEKWIAGIKDTIKWEGWAEDDTVAIFYSDDDGNNYDIIDTNIPANMGEYIWKIPETILSTKCRINIKSHKDQSITDTSGIFKIKGYVLTRDSSGQYEPFRFHQDKWNFSNFGENMWPRSWWLQFDYNGNDPFTGLQYGFQTPLRKPFSNTDSSDFPDWPLFVKAFGVDQCYWSTTLGIYKIMALIKWAALKKKWHGSCSGFAISSLQAFSHTDDFKTKFSEVPAFMNLISVTLDTSVRKVINELWIHWFGNPHRNYFSSLIKTPNQTLNDVKKMLLADNPDPGYLYFSNNNGGGAHAVTPYKLWHDPNREEHYRIYVYDNSYPLREDAYIGIDTSAFQSNGSWLSLLQPGWGGNKLLYLSDPVSTYLSDNLIFKPNREIAASTSTLIEMIPSLATDIIIRNGMGETIGFKDSIVIDNMKNAIPLTPATGSIIPPYAYIIPEGSFNISFDNFRDSTVELSIFTDTTGYTYNRSGVTEHQTDLLNYDGIFSYSNPDNEKKIISIGSTVVENNTTEKAYNILNCDVSENDSLSFSFVDNYNYKITNVGVEKTYNLSIEYASAISNPYFLSPEIILSDNSSHRIVPDWTDLQIVSIYIDLGNDGTIDDTLYLSNTVDVEDQGSLYIPEEYRLEQNYPNPFNPTTTIRYSIRTAGVVTLKVYNLIGEEIATLVNEEKSAGNYDINFDATLLPSGIYFYKLQAGSFTETKKMILIK
ncbi:MAG: T9SS type A sorting domain-containing protein [Ignavibacteriaceae bacterium]